MPVKPRPSATRSVKAPEALTALRSWLNTFDPRTRRRGADYYESGQVENVWADADHFLRAEVQGQSLYEVTLFFTRGQWSSRCSCPMGGSCKHAYAAGRAWIADVESGAVDRKELTPAPALAPPWSPPLRSADASPAPKKIPFREQWSRVLAEKLGRPLLPAESRRLGQLAALFTHFQQAHHTLYAPALAAHGFPAALPPDSDSWGVVFADWWPPDRAPADPWALWQYLAYSLERNGQPIPEVFRPLTNTAAVHAAVHSSLVQKELAKWRAAFTAPDALTSLARSNSVAGIASLRGRFTATGSLLVEVRAAASEPWKAPTQKWLAGLGAAFSADFAHLSEAEQALGVALAAERRAHLYVASPKHPLPAASVGRLLATAAARAALVLPDGQPLALAPTPLLREAVISAAARDRLELRLVTSDGRDASAAHLVAVAPGPLYLFENCLWPGPPPIPAPTLPTAALADTAIMSRLRAGGLRLPAAIEATVRRVTLRPRLRCWLSGDGMGGGTEQFHAQLFARADDPPCEQHWLGHGGWQWTKGGAPPPRRPDEPLLEFDLTAADAVGAGFAGFRLGWFGWADAWSRPAGRNFPDEFAAWHATLPPGLDLELAPELATLVGPPLRARVDFSAVPVEGSGQDWFDLTVALRVEDTALTPEEIALLLKARGKWVRLKSGWRRLDLAAGAGAENPADLALARLGLGSLDVLATGKSATHRLHALQLAGEAATFESRDAALAAALGERAARLAAIAPPALPAGLTATLRPYQVEGFHFLAHLSAHGFGGVLADDMGLGKTVQTLAWLLHLQAATKNFRALVVCPKSVMHGWLAETERFAPALQAAAFAPAPVAAEKSAAAPGLLVVNYTQLRLNAGWFQSAAWDAVVLDEGQFIKNPGSQIAGAVRALPSRHRLILTGTPVENRLTDLWSLFAFAQPGLLGAQAAFKRQHPEADPAALARLRRRTRHFLLRRTKAQAAPDLPPRTEDDLVVELEPAQRKLYDAELKRARAQLLGVETAHALDKVRFNVLASLLRLRQICCHPALIDPAHADLPSAKLDALLERIEELRDEGHQVLVFSQFVEMLELIRARLAAADIGHLILTGRTENRAELVSAFQTDRTKTVFLLSLKAAGFGLNLTAASYAILYDPWWNPAVEAQAIDRTHRIGQTKPVIAYRLLADHTVEQKIRALQKEKATLAAAVVQEESLASVMDLDSLRRILA
jgi:superfamily II DNA or RNA helicase